MLHGDSMSEKRAYLLCRFAERSGIYNSWMSRVSLPCVVVDDFAPDWQVPDDAGIVITHMHYRWEEIAALRRIYESSNVPVLILADGILEYRNMWEHPALADGCIFQPIIGHKLATIGYGQTRVIESWGNVGKCETIGLPRLDSARDNITPIRTEGTFRLLVATATTPAYDEVQRKAVIKSLQGLHKHLTTEPTVKGRNVEVTWRLTDGLDKAIGIETESQDQKRLPLSSVIDSVDAVITTPSTILLESALKNRPVAILDFNNAPQYVGAAWTISAPAHVNRTLHDLADPPAAKMMFQENILQYQLRCYGGSATDRMITLIEAMVAEGIAANEQRRDIEMPLRIIGDELSGFCPRVTEYELREQYPENAVFQNQDLERLQLELNLAIARMGDAPREAAKMKISHKNVKDAHDRLQVQLHESIEQNSKTQEALDRKQEALDRTQETLDRTQATLDRTQEALDRLQNHVQELSNSSLRSRRLHKKYVEKQKRAMDANNQQ